MIRHALLGVAPHRVRSCVTGWIAYGQMLAAQRRHRVRHYLQFVVYYSESNPYVTTTFNLIHVHVMGEIPSARKSNISERVCARRTHACAGLFRTGSRLRRNCELFFWNWAAPNDKVPKGKVLEIETLTLNYFPAGGGSVGRADVAGRDTNNSAVWRVQIVYVEPKKTTHLCFPRGLRLKAGGHVELSFTTDGPGKIFVSANGALV